MDADASRNESISKVISVQNIRKIILFSLLFVCLFGSPAAYASASCNTEAPARLFALIDQHFAARTLAELDGKALADRSFLVEIEHSITDEASLQIRLTSFAKLESWLKAYPATGILNEDNEYNHSARLVQGYGIEECVRCSADRCEMQCGILHNALFLSDMTFRLEKGCPIVTSLGFVDGD